MTAESRSMVDRSFLMIMRGVVGATEPIGCIIP
jgi:hypothetical protein